MTDAAPPDLAALVALVAQLTEKVDRLQRRIVDLERATGLYATNGELDSPKGDPKVRFPLQGWRGPDFVGKAYSQCDPEFLDQLATALQRMADSPKPGKEQYAAGNRADARRARSWARRLRASGAAPTVDPDAKPQERGAPRERSEPRARAATPRTPAAPRTHAPRRGREPASAEQTPEKQDSAEVDDYDFLGNDGAVDDFLSDERPSQ